MSIFKDDIKKVKAFIFDVDGVLSAEISPLDEEGEPVRTANIKDGYAIRCALSAGYVVGIITGGCQNRVRLRYQKLGITRFYDHKSEKITCLNDFISTTGIPSGNILYMGDDLPDYPVMKSVGIATCPADAIPEVKAISNYISDRKGGEGCVRDIIEQVMRSQGKWFEKSGLNNH